jgi:RNA polymerase sigma-70 factor (ECF subfamily)
MRTLADRLARGDDSAFAELYDACADRLYRFAAARLGSADAAADVVQTAFMRAVKSRRKFRRVENPIAYMFQIVRNEVIRAASAPGWKAEHASAERLAASADDGAADDAEALATALRRLDEDDREIVELKSYSGLTFAEIAELTQRPPGTIATRYRRALESLRSWLAKEFSQE